jgi:hypothetical protein
MRSSAQFTTFVIGLVRFENVRENRHGAQKARGMLTSLAASKRGPCHKGGRASARLSSSWALILKANLEKLGAQLPILASILLCRCRKTTCPPE